MNKLLSLKCLEVTSQRQADNGTICYYDPITGCDYLSYASGYIRRSYRTTSNRTGFNKTIYQLNPTRTVDWKCPYTERIFKCTERIMINSQEKRLDRLARAVVNYRKYQKS